MLGKLKEKMVDIRSTLEKEGSDLMPDEWKAPEEIAVKRFEICLACEHLYKPTRTCKKCGCFMGVKTRLASRKCPIDKWGPVDPIVPPKNDG